LEKLDSRERQKAWCVYFERLGVYTLVLITMCTHICTYTHTYTHTHSHVMGHGDGAYSTACLCLLVMVCMCACVRVCLRVVCVACVVCVYAMLGKEGRWCSKGVVNS